MKIIHRVKRPWEHSSAAEPLCPATNVPPDQLSNRSQRVTCPDCMRLIAREADGNRF